MKTHFLVSILRVASLLFMLSSCKKEPLSEIKNNTVNAQFVFVKGGEDLIKIATLKSYLYNIDEDKTNIYTVTYSSLDDKNGEYQLLDSLVHKQSKVGIGSRRKFEVDFRFYEPDMKHFTIYEYWSNDYAKGDTISSAEEAIEKFKWPEDTNSYILVFKEYYENPDKSQWID